MYGTCARLQEMHASEYPFGLRLLEFRRGSQWNALWIEPLEGGLWVVWNNVGTTNELNRAGMDMIRRVQLKDKELSHVDGCINIPIPSFAIGRGTCSWYNAVFHDILEKDGECPVGMIPTFPILSTQVVLALCQHTSNIELSYTILTSLSAS